MKLKKKKNSLREDRCWGGGRWRRTGREGALFFPRSRLGPARRSTATRRRGCPPRSFRKHPPRSCRDVPPPCFSGAAGGVLMMCCLRFLISMTTVFFFFGDTPKTQTNQTEETMNIKIRYGCTGKRELLRCPTKIEKKKLLGYISVRTRLPPPKQKKTRMKYIIIINTIYDYINRCCTAPHL